MKFVGVGDSAGAVVLTIPPPFLIFYNLDDGINSNKGSGLFGGEKYAVP